MSYGSGWGSSPWGSDDSLSQGEVLFDIESNDTSVEILDSEVFVNLSRALSLTFLAAAQSPTKVEVVFSVAVAVDAFLLDAANYTITQVAGSIQIPVLSVVTSGPLPLQRVTLEVGIPLDSKEYYFLNIAHTVTSLTGDLLKVDYSRFQWKDQTTPVFRSPLEIPIREFSGEVRGGILGDPDGLVFFSPAYEDIATTSTIELEQLSVCTLAYDSYEIPNPPDPVPLRTWGLGNTTVIGPTSVLWAPYDRLGLARTDLQYTVNEDPFEPAYDYNLSAVLVETIDITKGGGFMNDLRWKTFPGTTVFKTAANQSSIGSGPTTSVNLDWPKIYLGDSTAITDQVILNVLDTVIQDNCLIADTTVAFKDGPVNRLASDALSIQDESLIEKANQKVIVDNVTFTDQILVEDFFIGLDEDSWLFIADQVLVEALFVGLNQDSLSITDSSLTIEILTAPNYKNVTISDTPITILDQVLVEALFVGLNQDSISITDSSLTIEVLSGPHVKIVTISDTPITILDQIVVEALFVGLNQDSLSITDSSLTIEILSGSHLKDVVAADTVVLTDLASESVPYVRTLADALVTVDSLSKSVQYGRVLADTLVTVDSLSKSVQYGRVLADALTITDAVPSSSGALYTQTSSDTVSFTDSGLVESSQDSLVITDGGLTVALLTSGGIKDVGVSDTPSVTDATSKSAQYGRLSADAIVVADSGLVESSQDSLSITDSVTLG